MKLLTILLLSVTIGFSCSNNGQYKQSEPLPNIILILADDLGWSDIGCFGSEVHTPNLDSLAFNGIRFTNMHNTSKCFPSRACLLTGIYAQQNGYSKSFNQPLMNCITLGEALKSAGYRTLWSGKHHGIENPVTRGFDRYYGLKDGATNYFNPGKQREGEGKPAQKRNDRKWCIDSVEFSPYTPAEKDFYTTDYFTKYALNWLEEYKEEENPYFLLLAYNAPHDPLQAWPEDIEKYRGKYLGGYEKTRNKRYQKQLETGLLDSSYILSAPLYADWDAFPDSVKVREDLKMAVYAAMIDRMDQNIGKILKKVKALGEEENTIIIFLSDNGASAEMVNLPGSGPIGSMTRWTSLGADWANVGNTPFRYFKNYSYEGGIRSPMIFYWPREIKEPGSLNNFPCHFIDIMPTLLSISGASYPDSLNGKFIYPLPGESLLPAISDPGKRREEPVFWQWSKGSAVLEDQWKIVKQGQDNHWDLYNIEKDPCETKNISEEFPGIVSRLDSLFHEWQSKHQ